MSVSPKPSAAAQSAVDEAITSRRSVRAFLPTPIPESTIREILEVAARAPSGTNTQPWKVHVLQGAKRDLLSQRVMAVHNDPQERALHAEEYAYYPQKWVSPFIDRRRKIGWDMYGLLGITKGDKQRMHEQEGRNFLFFDAPVGLVFSIDRIMQQGSWLDYGMFLENIMIAARGRGLDTCPQAAFNDFHRVIAQTLEFPPHEMFVCAMSLGVADPDAAINRLQTVRESVADFATFHQ